MRVASTRAAVPDHRVDERNTGRHQQITLSGINPENQIHPASPKISLSLARPIRSNFPRSGSRRLICGGEDAAFVYDLTSYYISHGGDAARGMAGNRMVESEPISGRL